MKVIFQNKPLMDLIMLILLILFIGIMIYLAYQIKEDGTKCILNPMNYTMERNKDLVCTCINPTMFEPRS